MAGEAKIVGGFGVAGCDLQYVFELSGGFVALIEFEEDEGRTERVGVNGQRDDYD